MAPNYQYQYYGFENSETRPPVVEMQTQSQFAIPQNLSDNSNPYYQRSTVLSNQRQMRTDASMARHAGS